MSKTKKNSDLLRTVEGLRYALLTLARLAAETPQFYSPLEVHQAQRLRDKVLANYIDFIPNKPAKRVAKKEKGAAK